MRLARMKIFAVPLLFTILVIGASASHGATVLNINAPSSTALWSRGGVYQAISITGGANPVISIINRALTLTGGGASGQLVTGSIPATLHVNSARLNLGAATTSYGGTLSGQVQLQANAELRVYPASSAIPATYVLSTTSPSSGTITGEGTLLLREDAILQSGGIGTQDVPLEHVELDEGSRLQTRGDIYAGDMRITEASLTALSGNISGQNLVLQGGSSLFAQTGNVTLGNVQSIAPENQISGLNAIDALEGNISITGTLTLESGLTRITAAGDVSIASESGTTGNGTLYLRAGGNVQAGSGSFASATIEALKLNVGDDLKADNVIAAQLSAKSATLAGDLTVGGKSVEIFGNRVDFGILELDSANTQARSEIGGNLNVSDARVHTGQVTVGGKAYLERVQGTMGGLAAKGSVQIGAATLETGDLSASALVLGNRQYATTVTAGSVTAGRVQASPGAAVNLNVQSLTAEGAVSGGDNFSIEAKGAVKAESLRAGKITAGSLAVTSGSLTLTGAEKSLVTGAVSIQGAEAGSFGTLETGDFSVARAKMSGQVLSGQGVTVTEDGEIKATSIAAKGDALANGGTMTAESLGAQNVTTATGGEITATKLEAQGDVQANAGTITAETLVAQNVRATAGGEIKATKLEVKGNVQAGGGTITTNTLAAQNVTAIAGGEIKATSIAAKGDVKASDGTISAETLTAQNVNVTPGGAITATNLEAKGDALANGGTITAETLAAQNVTVTADGEINATKLEAKGDAQASGGTITAKTLAAQNVFVADGGEISTNMLSAARIGAANGHLNARTIAGNPLLGIGQKARVSLGQANGQWLERELALTQNGSASALGVYSPVSLSGLDFNPALAVSSASQGIFHFAPESLLVLNAENAKEPANSAGLIRGTGTASIADGARLVLAGVSANANYGVFGPGIAVRYAGSAWEGDNLETTSHLISARKIAGRDGWFTTTPKPAQIVYPDLDPGIAPPLDTGVSGGQLGTESTHFNSEYVGVRFLSRVGSTTYMDHDYRGAVKTLESATRIALLGAVPQIAYAAGMEQADAGQERALFADQPDADFGRSFSLWIKPLYRSLNMREWPANNFNYDIYANLGGIVLGADWTFADHFRAGFDATLGGAYAKSGGDLAKTVNKAGFAGAGVYAGFAKNGLALSLDGQYTGSWNSITQRLPRTLEMRDITGQMTGRAISAGFGAKYDFRFGDFWLSPHAGARYTWLVTDKYTVYSDGALLNGDRIEQSIWTFPAGVEFGAAWQMDGGWKLSASLDAGLIAAAGDLDGRSRVHYTGVPGTGDVKSQMLDHTVFTAGLGLEASMGGFTAGISGNMQMGMHGEATSLFALLRYEF